MSEYSNGLLGVDIQQINREKEKARQIRKTQWWKNLRAHNRCYYCQETFRAKHLTMDHIIPISRGGFSEKNNLVPCCKKCNSKKKNLLAEEWKEYLISKNSKS